MIAFNSDFWPFTFPEELIPLVRCNSQKDIEQIASDEILDALNSYRHKVWDTLKDEEIRTYLVLIQDRNKTLEQKISESDGIVRKIIVLTAMRDAVEDIVMKK
jgi:hypothetical protein